MSPATWVTVGRRFRSSRVLGCGRGASAAGGAPHRVQRGHWVNATQTLVEASKHDVGKAHGPNAIIDLFERDVFARQSGREKQRVVDPRYTPVAADEADFRVAWILEVWQSTRKRTRRRLVMVGRRVVVQRFVRALAIVFRAERGKPPLLRRGTRGGRPGRVRFQHAMKLLVRCVLLRMPWGNALREDSQADPPDRQTRQAGEPGTGEGAAIVTTNASRQAIL